MDPLKIQCQRQKMRDILDTEKSLTPSRANASSPTVNSAQTPPTIVVETRTLQKEKGLFSTISRLRKPIVGLLVAYALLATGAGGFMFTKMLRIQGLDDQIEDLTNEVVWLEREVESLSGVIDILQSQIDRFETERKIFEESNHSLTTSIFNLKQEGNATKELLIQMNSSNEEYKQLNLELEDVNVKYKENNEYLNHTVQELTNEIITLNLNEINLNSSITQYRHLNGALELEIKSLTNITSNLTKVVNELDISIESLKDENARFRRLNKDLRIIVSFVGNKTDDLRLSYEYLVSTLAEQMLLTWTIMKENMHNRFLEQLADWDCELSNRFRLQPFAKDEELPIGAQFYDKVITHLDNRLLSDLCIDKKDFQLFLISEKLTPGFEMVDISMTLLKEGVSQYVSEALNYYFPDGNESGGMNDTEWHNADYSCLGIPKDRRFKWHNELVLDDNPGVQCSMKSIDVCM